jgi:HEAT repeat protein
VELLRRRLRPAAPAEAARLAAWLTDLEGDSPATRERAARELEKLAELAGPALKKFLDGDPSPEARKRAELLLERLAGPATRPELVRALRSVELLERIGKEEARAVLATLARGAAGARLTWAARDALERFGR